MVEAENLIKGECPKCNAPFTFPARGLGEQVPCPHCGKPVVLQPVRPAKSEHAGTGEAAVHGSRKRPAIIAGAVAMIVLLWALGFCVSYWINNPQWMHKNPPLAAVEPPDPVAEMKGIVEEYKRISPSGYWGWDYDVQKNDSLVKPYLGTIKNTFGYDDPRMYQVDFLCYQDGKWRLINSKSRFSAGEWTYTEVSVATVGIDSYYARNPRHKNKP